MLSVNSELIADKSNETIESEHLGFSCGCNIDFHSTPKTLSDECCKAFQLDFAAGQCFTGFVSDHSTSTKLIKISEIIQETNVIQSSSNMSEQSVQTGSWHSMSIVINTETVTLNVKSKKMKGTILSKNVFFYYTFLCIYAYVTDYHCWWVQLIAWLTSSSLFKVSFFIHTKLGHCFS